MPTLISNAQVPYFIPHSALPITFALMQSIEVNLINNPDDQELAYAIRREVFVQEQQVDEREEYDEYEPTASHFLAREHGQPVGTARWRFTDKGIKLERFAVRATHRNAGVGAALLMATLNHINQHPDAEGKTRYLHAQLTALPFYARHGFRETGDVFEEANILHRKMELPR